MVALAYPRILRPRLTLRSLWRPTMRYCGVRITDFRGVFNNASKICARRTHVRRSSSWNLRFSDLSEPSDLVWGSSASSWSTFPSKSGGVCPTHKLGLSGRTTRGPPYRREKSWVLCWAQGRNRYSPNFLVSSTVKLFNVQRRSRFVRILHRDCLFKLIRTRSRSILLTVSRDIFSADVDVIFLQL